MMPKGRQGEACQPYKVRRQEGNAGEGSKEANKLRELGEIGLVEVKGKNDPEFRIWKEEKDWVDEEFQNVRLPNLAKKKRVMSVARDFFARPASSIPMACDTGAKLRGAYSNVAWNTKAG